jgi:vancomycin resistance protein YoaR
MSKDKDYDPIKNRLTHGVAQHDFPESSLASMSANLWKRNLLIGIGVFLALILLSGGSSWIYRSFYNGKIFPGVYVGQHSLGGLTAIQAKDLIENFNNRMAKESLDFNYQKNGESQHFQFSVVPTDDSSVEMIRINSDSSVAKLMSVGRSGGFWKDLWQPLYFAFISPRNESVYVTIDDRFMSNLQNYMLAFSDTPHNANVKITGLAPLTYAVVPEHYGVEFDYDKLKIDLQKNLFSMSLESVPVYKKEFKPEVSASDLQPLLGKLPNVLNYGDLGLNFIDPQTKGRRDWSIGPVLYTDWLEVRHEKDDLIFALNQEKVKAYLETIRPYIDIPVQNTQYVMEDNKIKEFRGSQSGITLNVDKTYNDLDSLFRERNFSPVEVAKTVTVSVDVIKPNVVTSDVNNLGEMEVLGVGYSTFKDSHTNRIKNITNAVKKLDGVLIKPGEEFSAIRYAGPFTSEEGFLPEMVIKGNEITPEVGGGMCQIGTTLFRMAMNSGMPISQRRNHSLVVGYYADPVNGNPGTDATLYEPSVDFKFINDTGGYLLIQTSIDYTKQQLVFTLWGKTDGRSGSYTHPTVSKWIPAGAPQEVVSPDLKPGEQKCQNAFRGAVASFTYTRFTSTSEKIERVFDSYYRPLPKICMVGATSTPGVTTDIIPSP